MTARPTIAVAHYPEGAGHATRMLAIANALRDAGASVEMAGGGAGTEFVAIHGYDEFEPTPVDYIDTYQGESIRDVLADSAPATAARVTEYVEWLRDRDPDALVTDDMFAAIAAARTDVPLYVLKHDLPALYEDRLERAGAAFHTSFQRSTARAFFYPTVWPASAGDTDDVTPIPPVALAGDGRDGPAPEVVVVPSHYSDLGRIADQLDRQGYDVLEVGSDDWEPVDSLLPYIRDAEVVVCSGYSTVMDAAVAGTPCVVHPATDEQRAVANCIERFDVPGFAVAPEPLDVLEAVDSPPAPPVFDNGAGLVAEAVLEDIAASGRSASSRTRGSASKGGRMTAVLERVAPLDAEQVAALTTAKRRIDLARRHGADRLLAGLTALASITTILLRHGRQFSRAALRALAAGAVATYRIAASTWRSVTRRVGHAAAALVNAGRKTARRYPRYRTATVAMGIAVLVVAGSGVRGGATDAKSGLTSRASALYGAVRDWSARVPDVLATAADLAGRTADRVTGLGRRLRGTRWPSK